VHFRAECGVDQAGPVCIDSAREGYGKIHGTAQVGAGQDPKSDPGPQQHQEEQVARKPYFLIGGAVRLIRTEFVSEERLRQRGMRTDRVPAGNLQGQAGREDHKVHHDAQRGGDALHGTREVLREQEKVAVSKSSITVPEQSRTE